MKSGNNDFDVKRLNDHLIVSNKKNGLEKTQEKLPDNIVKLGLSSFITYDRDEAQRMLSIIKADFLKRGRPVPYERPIGVFYVGKGGEILEVRFILSEKTGLTIEDIDALEIALKERYHFKVAQGKLGSAKFALCSTFMRFDEIASK